MSVKLTTGCSALANKSRDLMAHVIGMTVRLRIDEYRLIAGEVLDCHERRLENKRVIWGITVRTPTGHEYTREVRELPLDWVDSDYRPELKTEDFVPEPKPTLEIAMFVEIGNGERACAW